MAKKNIFNHKFKARAQTVGVVTIGFTSVWGIATTPARAAGFDITSTTLGPLEQDSATTVNGITYLNQSLPITNLTANANWIPGTPAVVTLRRGGYAATDNSGNFNDRQPITAERLPGDPQTTVRIPPPMTTGTVLSQNNLLLGADNVFVNSGYNGTQSDIERVDFVINQGVGTSPNRAIAVFDLGSSTDHDPFQVAPILSIDSAGNPTSYGSLLSIPIGWGKTNLRPGGGTGNNLNHTVLANYSETFSDVRSVNQQVGGLLIPLSELSATPSTIYGYSLFAPDVNDGGNSANLLDWKNPTVFPQNTSNSLGGIDPMAANLGVLEPVPEPSSVAGVVLFGISIAAWKLKKSTS